jgi:solute carrier family 25 protein 39/40
MSVPATVLYFTTYDQLRVRFIEHVDPSVAPTLSGLTARLFASTVTSPLELIRTKAQSLSSSQYRGAYVIKER